ncbi:MAG: LLM class F420-dependent oxidoreductase [Acidimicrobiia bacterium]|jgi:F420-dependent oxidoreductase-like protein
MQLGISFGYQDWGTGLPSAIALAQEADRLGYESGWVAEAYGTDAITPITWLLAHTERLKMGTAIAQMPARAPAMTAMTAATLDLMSNGRFLLGIGASGPQVSEGWYGEPYGKPLAKTREYVDILRAVWRREAPLEHHGEFYDIPYTGPDASGLGKPLKIIVHPRTADIPIYVASIGPKNVELTAEIANGWLPIFYSPTKADAVWGAALDAGFAKAGGGKGPADLDVAATVSVLVGDDVAALRDMVKPMVALYVGGMGAKGKNFYNDLACRYGYEGVAAEIQDLYLSGKKAEAIALVPDDLVDDTCLIGPEERIADRLDAWRESRVSTLVVTAGQPEALRLMAELVL